MILRMFMLALAALAMPGLAAERVPPAADDTAALQLAYCRDVIHFNAGDTDGRRVLAAALLARFVPVAERFAEGAAAELPAATPAADPRHDHALQLLAAAQALAPDDPLVAWAAVMVAHEKAPPGHAHEAALDRLLALDGDNAAAWLEWTHRHRDDPSALALGIERAAASRYHAFRSLELTRTLVTAMQRVPLPLALQGVAGDANAADPQAVRFVIASGIAQAVVLPSLATASEACRGEALEDDARRRHCLALGRLLAGQADSLLGQGLGLSIWQRAADSPAERDAAASRRRTVDWQRVAFGEWLQEDPDGMRWAELGALWLEPGLEEPELQARALAIAGIPLSPPGDWLPGSR